jgi:hypothetical protein
LGVFRQQNHTGLLPVLEEKHKAMPLCGYENHTRKSLAYSFCEKSKQTDELNSNNNSNAVFREVSCDENLVGQSDLFWTFA